MVWPLGAGRRRAHNAAGRRLRRLVSRHDRRVSGFGTALGQRCARRLAVDLLSLWRVRHRLGRCVRRVLTRACSGRVPLFLIRQSVRSVVELACCQHTERAHDHFAQRAAAAARSARQAQRHARRLAKAASARTVGRHFAQRAVLGDGAGPLCRQLGLLYVSYAGPDLFEEGKLSRGAREKRLRC